jgi:predicted DCC family thiol-disulfide oxidoreductase YuxK
MISLASDFTDSKGRKARGWLFYDSECEFCSRVANWLRVPMIRRGLDLAPLQDPRVSPLLGMPRAELLRAVRYLNSDGQQFSGADALLAIAREFKWARPLIWLSRVPGVITLMRVTYRWVASLRKCHATVCATTS